MEITYKNQIAIVEIGEQGQHTVTGYTYPLNLEAAHNGSDALGDVAWPEAPGIYLWSGNLWYDDGVGQGEYGGQGDPDGGADGEIRPATVTEVELHNLNFLQVAALIDELRGAKATAARALE